MIARFLDLGEAVLLRKNDTLEKFLTDNVEEKNQSVISHFLRGRTKFSFLLPDGKPGDWFVFNGRDGNDYLVFSVSVRTHVNGDIAYSPVIYMFRLVAEEKNIRPYQYIGFDTAVPINDKEKVRNASAFMRNLMKRISKLNDIRDIYNFLIDKSHKIRWWTEEDLKDSLS